MAPIATVASAGHIVTGGYCDCRVVPGCICDGGDEQTGQRANPVPDQTKRSTDQGASPIGTRSGLDLGTGALMLVLALFVWTRLRA